MKTMRLTKTTKPHIKPFKLLHACLHTTIFFILYFYLKAKNLKKA